MHVIILKGTYDHTESVHEMNPENRIFFTTVWCTLEGLQYLKKIKYCFKKFDCFPWNSRQEKKLHILQVNKYVAFKIENRELSN